jgi:hypothetical protein
MSGKQVRRQRRRFWIEVGLASAFAVMLVVTLISREWIEAIFGVDPDGGNGTLEWAIVAGLGLAAIAAVLLARKEWRRTISAAVRSAV